MSYFLLRQNRQNGELDLITRIAYDSQQEALQALSLESSHPEFQHEDFDFCIGYMDATIPVLIVLSAAAEEPLPLEPPEPLLVPAPPQPLVTPLQDSQELQEESGAVSESAPVPYENSDAVLEKIIEQSEAEGKQVSPSKDDSLSGAPKRAAGQLEAEGNVDSDALLPGEAKISVLEDLTIVTSDSPDSNAETDQPISATEPSAPGPDIQCDDCVYVSTCPNKEGANPATCGNFQWKAV